MALASPPRARFHVFGDDAFVDDVRFLSELLPTGFAPLGFLCSGSSDALFIMAHMCHSLCMSVEPLSPMQHRVVDNNMPEKNPEIANELLRWYDSNARDLPWRAAPHSNSANPYHVWLSEIMLQQTTVAAVKPYFAKLTVQWPDIAALAAAKEEDVLAAWAGLGYYARARNLVKCARQVMAEYDGVFPSTEQALRTLPGVGDYTAAAIAAIAFGQRAVVVDANVERVVARLYCVNEPLPNARKTIRSLTDDITPQSRSGDFAQAMMDLGSSVCRAREAQCAICPLQPHCQVGQAGQANMALRYPVKKPKKAKPVRQGSAYWIEKQGAIWLVKRPDDAMLGGMRAMPDNGWRARNDGDVSPPLNGPWSDIGEPVIHHFTHFTIHLQLKAYQGSVEAVEALTGQNSGEWWPIETLEQAGLPTLFAKAAQIGQRQLGRLL